MPIIVELISSAGSITLNPAPDTASPWVYNNATLDAWYALAPADPRLSKRPNAPGAYDPGQIYSAEHRPIVNGQYYGQSAAEALAARNDLNALFSDGRSVTMRVTDDLGATSREVWLLEADTAFRYDFAHFPFDLVFVAPDPRRYAPTTSDSQGVPEAGTGLVWDLGTAASGLFFDWGSEGVLGQVSFTNGGTATTFPRIEVGGAGAFVDGFRLTEIETGRELTFERSTNAGEAVVFDSRTQRATLASGDVTAFLSSREWFEIPAATTRRYQLSPLGAVTGAPTITIYAASAYL